MSDFEYLFKRTHSHVRKNFKTWLRSEAAYSGGSQYIEKALIKHISEVEPEFDERKKRAYYFNYPRKIARLISQFILSEAPQRIDANADIVEDFSRSGLRVGEVMRQASTYINMFGLAWFIVDMPSVDGELNIQSKKQANIRPFARALKPWDVVDYADGSDGKLDWAIVQESRINKSDPFEEPEIVTYRRLWTRTDWKLFKKEDKTGKIELASSGNHNLGMVPLVKCEEADGYGMNANHWFEDVVRISDAIMNASNEAQMNIIKQMFGLLVVSESFKNADYEATESNDDSEKFSHILARSAAIWETHEEKGLTRYISPNGTETEAIRQEVANLKKELFDVVGLAVQQESKDAQTAESKAWDHHNVSQFLVSRVDLIEQAEQQIWRMMNAWDSTVKEPEISYNREFAVLDLSDSIQALLDLDNFNAGDEFHREVSRSALKLLDKIKKVDPKSRKIIESEIEQLTNEVPTPEVRIPGQEDSAG